MEKIAVVGGAGYIGSHTVRQLKTQGYDVAVIDNLSTGFRESLPAGTKFYQADVLNLTALRDVFREVKFSAILHFAAKLSVPESFPQFDAYFQTNVVGTHHLLMMCREFGINKFIFSSTAAVYGNCTDHYVDEYQSLQPQNPYGVTKKMSEELLASFAATQPNFHYKILRYFNVAGAELDASNGPRNLKSGQLLLNLCLKSLSHQAVEIYGHDFETPDGTAIRDYIHVVDLAAAHVEAYLNIADVKSSKVWNCGYGHGFSVLEVVKSFEKANQLQLEKVFKPKRQGDPAMVVAQNKRILNESAWRPQHDHLDTICRTTYQWVKMNHG